MNKLFTKIGVAFVGIAMAVGVGVGVGAKKESAKADADTANDFISLANGKGTSGSGSQFTITSAGISFTFAKGYGNGTQIRSYEYTNNAVTLTVDSTKVDSISSITMTVGDSKLGGTWTGDCSYSSSTVTWTSTASGAAIKHTTQARFTAISVLFSLNS